MIQQLDYCQNMKMQNQIILWQHHHLHLVHPNLKHSRLARPCASGNKDAQSTSTPSNYGNNNNYDDQEDDEDKFTNLQSIRKHQTEMIHQEVTPLDRVDHKQIHYDSFNRVFYTPTNTEAGSAWRREHEVVCTQKRSTLQKRTRSL